MKRISEDAMKKLASLTDAGRSLGLDFSGVCGGLLGFRGCSAFGVPEAEAQA